MLFNDSITILTQLPTIQMKTMKKFLLLFLFPALSFGQVIEMRNYDFEKNPCVHTLTKTEAAEPVILIKDKRVIEYVYNKNDEFEEYYTLHRIVYINEDNAIESYNKIYVAVSNSQDLIAFKARTISKTGVVKEMLKGEMKSVTDEGNHYLSLAVDGLEKGSELEYFYTIKQDPSMYGAQMIQGRAFARKVELTLVSPENIILGTKAYNGFPQLKDTLIGKKNMYTGTMENIVTIDDEKYTNLEANKMRVEYKIAKNTKRSDSELMTYADAGNRYYASFTTLEKGEQKDVEKLYSKLNVKNLPDLEKIRAIESYIKTNINIQKGAEVKDISEILKTKISDEYTINKLSIALFHQTGIKFEIVISNSRADKIFDPDFQSWNNLSDLLFYFPSLDKYVQSTSFVDRLAMPPSEYVGNGGLFIKEITIRSEEHTSELQSQR